MALTSKRAARSGRIAASLPDGVGGTITAGPMVPLDLSEVLGRGRAGLPGAARILDEATPASRARETEVALSDGSKIIFSSLRAGRQLIDA